MTTKNTLPTERSSHPLASFRNEMNEFFDRFTRELFPESRDNFIPRVEVKDNGSSYLLSAELPGLKEEDINLTLKDNTLILEGEKKNEFKKEGKGFYRSEFSYGSFYRAIPLASDVNPDTVVANYEDGVLKITLDKMVETESKTKKINISKGTDSLDSTKH